MGSYPYPLGGRFPRQGWPGQTFCSIGFVFSSGYPLLRVSIRESLPYVGLPISPRRQVPRTKLWPSWPHIHFHLIWFLSRYPSLRVFIEVLALILCGLPLSPRPRSQVPQTTNFLNLKGFSNQNNT
uniref:Uncharacterized protein n=1 Tax=Cacopsylla melanoneura TaxID=428564 RepID=A0A8D8VXZ8_9HEMI